MEARTQPAKRVGVASRFAVKLVLIVFSFLVGLAVSFVLAALSNTLAWILILFAPLHIAFFLLFTCFFVPVTVLETPRYLVAPLLKSFSAGFALSFVFWWVFASGTVNLKVDGVFYWQDGYPTLWGVLRVLREYAVNVSGAVLAVFIFSAICSYFQVRETRANRMTAP